MIQQYVGRFNPKPVPDIPVGGLCMNYNCAIFLGNERDAANRETLRDLGVTHVLNATSHLPLHFLDDGITYKRLPASDSANQNLKQYFNDAFQFIGTNP